MPYSHSGTVQGIKSLQEGTECQCMICHRQLDWLGRVVRMPNESLLGLQVQVTVASQTNHGKDNAREGICELRLAQCGTEQLKKRTPIRQIIEPLLQFT